MTGPLPLVDELSAPYWEAAARGELHLPRCANCSAFTLPPEMVCPSCGTTEPRWSYVAVSGTGTVRSWTVVRQAFLPGLDVPYVIVDVELDDQPDLRLVSRLLDGPDAVHLAGAKVEAAFSSLGDDLALPVFRLSPAEAMPDADRTSP